MKIVAAPARRPQPQRGSPEALRDEVHDAVLDLQFAGDAEEARRLDQHGVLVEDLCSRSRR